VVEQYGGELANDPGAIKAELELKGNVSAAATVEEKKVTIKSVKEHYLEVAMFATNDKSRFKKLNEDLEKDFTKGHNTYPTNTTTAYNHIFNYNQTRLSGRTLNDSEGGMTFANVEYTSSSTPR
jgi:hypothetical protein